MDKNTMIIAAVVVIIAVAGVAAYALMSDDGDTGNSDQDVVYDDVRLTLFGNANGDDTVDEKDLRIIDKIMAGEMEKSESPYADANRDGNIDQKDKDIVNKLIAGEKTEVYINDHSGRSVKLEYPVDNIISINEDATTWHITFGARDVVAGHSANPKSYPNTLKAFDGTDTQVIPGGRGGLSAAAWEKIIEIDKNLSAKGEKIGAVITDRMSNLGDYADDLEKNGIPAVVIRVTDPVLTINGVTLMSYLYGKEIEESGKKFVDRSDAAMDYLNGKLASIPESERVPFLAFCMTNALAQKESQYTLVGIAAGGKAIVEVDGASSDKIQDVEAITKYDGKVKQILEMKTLDITLKSMESIWEDDKLAYLEKSAAYDTTTFINLSMPGVCKVIYAAHIMYPDLVSREYADNLLQGFFDDFMPFYHDMQPDKHLDVTTDMTTISSYKEWQEYQKNKA